MPPTGILLLNCSTTRPKESRCYVKCGRGKKRSRSSSLTIYREKAVLSSTLKRPRRPIGSRRVICLERGVHKDEAIELSSAILRSVRNLEWWLYRIVLSTSVHSTFWTCCDIFDKWRKSAGRIWYHVGYISPTSNKLSLGNLPFCIEWCHLVRHAIAGEWVPMRRMPCMAHENV